MSNNYIIKAVFLLLSNISFFIFNSQLNSFYEDWEPRSLDINFNNPNIQNEINSSANVQININPSNEIADVLPSHFGTNLPQLGGFGGSNLGPSCAKLAPIWAHMGPD